MLYEKSPRLLLAKKTPIKKIKGLTFAFKFVRMELIRKNYLVIY